MTEHSQIQNMQPVAHNMPNLQQQPLVSSSSSATQANKYKKHYQNQVIQKISINIIVCSILVFFLYILVDIGLFNIDSQKITLYQRRYLIQTQALIKADLDITLNRAKTLIDTIRQLSNFPSSSLPIHECNSTRYTCPTTSAQKIWNYMEPYYATINKMYDTLIKSMKFTNGTDGREDAEIFVVVESQKYCMNVMFDGMGTGGRRLAGLLCGWVLGRDVSRYLVKLVKVQQVLTNEDNEDSIQYIYKILICGQYTPNSSPNSICMLTPHNLATVPSHHNKQNPLIFIPEQPILISSTNTASIPKCTQCSSDKTLQSMAAQQTPLLNALAVDKPFFQAFPLQNCVNQYRKTDYLLTNRVRVCNPPQLFSFLSIITIFVYAEVSIQEKFYQQAILLPTKQQPTVIPYLVFSNSTLNQRQAKRMKQFYLKHSYTLQTVVIILALWLVIVPYLPLKILTDLATSITIVCKMCNIIKNIKQKDQLELQIDNFNKLNVQINKYHHIFYSTIQYFKYFIWYRKWLYTTKNSKKKLLLQQGLSLFGSADYAPVYMYIFHKQIEMDIRLSQNYKKMRKIFMQKFTVYKNQDKIDNSFNVRKPKVPARNKKSNFGRQAQCEMDVENGVEESMDFCMVDVDRKIENRMNKQLQIMSIQKKNKRFVRFSYDVHNQQQKLLQNIVSKFLLNYHNPVNTSNRSQKYIYNDQLKKEREQQYQNNGIMQSSKDSKQKVQMREQSSQSDKNYEHWNNFMKFDQNQSQNETDQIEDQCYDIKKLTYKKLDNKLSQAYENVYRTYEKMIVIKKMYLDKQDVTEIQDYINVLYQMLIQKLRYFYKYIKLKNSQKQKMLKSLTRRRITLNNNNLQTQNNLTQPLPLPLPTLASNLNINLREKTTGNQRHMKQTISILDQQIEEESKIIDIEFKQFMELEERYKIDGDLMERARLYQIKLLKTLNYPIQYKKLENLCDSKNHDIRVQARIIMAEEFFYISPHADMESMWRVHENLQQLQTTHMQKQKTLKLMIQILKNRQIMQDQQYQIQLIKNYYNYNHKKFYFVVDLSDNYEVFRSTLEELYKNMGQVDMFQIMNLAMNQILSDMVITDNQIKPNNLQDFLNKFQGVYNQANRIKSVVSTKVGNKRMAFEKDFNRIISKIQQQDINLSKFIVLILGGENQNQSKTHQDYQSSSAHNRQIYQIVHQEILSKLERNYFHVILIGFNLKDYQTKQGKLKKYVRHTHDLLEIDLGKTNLNNYFKEMAKFLNK